MRLEITRHDLKILSICYYIQAGLLGFYALLVVAYGALFATILQSIPHGPDQAQLPAGTAKLIGVVLSGMGVLTAVAALVTFLCGRYLPRASSRTFCYVVAALTCLGIPYGTVLGIFTFMVLGRPEAKQIAAGEGTVIPVVVPPLPPEGRQ
jgi:hypothetical protein